MVVFLFVEMDILVGYFILLCLVRSSVWNVCVFGIYLLQMALRLTHKQNATSITGMAGAATAAGSMSASGECGSDGE